MWIFTETGFVSVVRHYEDEHVLVVRARDRESLRGLEQDSATGIEKTPRNDYPYRVYLTEDSLIKWFVNLLDKAIYSNFKDRVYETRGSEFASSLLGVWSIMREVEDEGARS